MLIKGNKSNKINFITLSVYFESFFKDVVFKFPPISRPPFSLTAFVLDHYPSQFLGLDYFSLYISLIYLSFHLYLHLSSFLLCLYIFLYLSFFSYCNFLSLFLLYLNVNFIFSPPSVRILYNVNKCL